MAGRHRRPTPLRTYIVWGCTFAVLTAAFLGLTVRAIPEPQKVTASLSAVPSSTPPVPPLAVIVPVSPPVSSGPEKDAPTTRSSPKTTAPKTTVSRATASSAPKTTAPKTVAPKTTDAVSQASSRFGGVAPHVAQVGNFLQAEFGVDRVWGLAARPNNPTSDHPKGLALDFMVNTSTGNSLARCALSRMEDWNITYVLWQVPDHYDHVHISFEASGNPVNLTC